MNHLATSHFYNISVHTDLLLGFRVLGSEFKWIFIRSLRNWEISQLRKRLHQEYHTLGMIEAAASDLEIAKAGDALDIFDEKELAIKQISFLLDEISFLTDQLRDERQEYVRRRVQKWKLT
ncbi:hypothetical protein SAMN05660653_00214 [Desulfonatronum thiosulfatophilum]|uniref:Uncharacterized protein n=1 Tax=Desulfonatronum thiosulfatophilum TaxID=617002 RepID=A0A1G6A856_9BACT|nr:hypothetical protein [Desulfonatronum thiosulfatophilum]SDB04470.1 hypothetical protein SAMN05660653_00214 [Desulfonatronum thiosulfatophilum]